MIAFDTKQLVSADNGWWLRANFYSLYIDKFNGDINGLTDKLTYFTELGIDALHIMPHYPSPLRDGGYDITDHTGVRTELGSVADFEHLCTAAHARNIKIVVDLVLNHVSCDHPWFVEARQSTDNPKREYFLWSNTAMEYKDAPNVFPDFKDSNWIPNAATQDYYYATFKPSQPDLNWSNPAVLAEMLSVIDTLISYGVDGFRLDAIMNLVERDGTNSVGLPETHARIRDVRSHLDANYTDIILLGEVIGTTDYSRQYFGESDECHLSYNFELMAETLYALVIGGKTERLKAVLEASKALPPGASWAAFLRNHDSLTLSTLDTNRHHELLRAIDAKKEFAFNKGAETVQRLFDICDQDETLVREAFSMLYAIPSATVMYYGDEIGMTNAPLPPDEDDMRYVVRAPFDWGEAKRQKRDPHSLLQHVKACIAGRKNLPSSA